MSKTADLVKKDNELLLLPDGITTAIGMTGITAIRNGKTLIVFGEYTDNLSVLSGRVYMSVRFASKPHLMVEPLRSAGASGWIRADVEAEFQSFYFDRSADTPFRWMAIGNESDIPFDPTP